MFQTQTGTLLSMLHLSASQPDKPSAEESKHVRGMHPRTETTDEKCKFLKSEKVDVLGMVVLSNDVLIYNERGLRRVSTIN
jgi:hypothetical protein